MRDPAAAGDAATARLVDGTPLPDALDVDDPRAWLALDAGVRRTQWSAGLPRREYTTWLADPGVLDDPRLALALCHLDGRVRQQALGRADGRPALLPLVVIRAADWAEPVRERARTLLRLALDLDTAVSLAPLILLVGRRGRGGHAVGLLDEVLRAAPVARLAPLLGHADRAVRRFTHRLAVDARLLSAAELAGTAARDDDVVVQRLCSDAALAAVAEGRGTVDDVLAPLLAARNPHARASGVTALRRAGRPERAEDFLADRSALVRACARYVVRQHGGEPPQWYRRRCAAPDALPPGAVIGLAECGERADAGLLWPLVDHPDPRVRAQAVAGLRVLDVDVRRLWPLLEDPAAGVVREVTRALLPSARSLDAAWLTGLLAPERPTATKVAARRLLDAYGPP
ncbi:hypothetical protein C3489_34680 [Streptomyces sp. Ru71]|uniref:hypothetical protein n=1 Tax=Streptomyces sp. Ru71 TaxID=2080746 RepID=UPI000CDD162F|nr:hypothetical protein [Streptomyces sp. Ru71]POX45266.1 hypothetical protein C3489_34680 [Streptomyces sp. Ru71]